MPPKPPAGRWPLSLSTATRAGAEMMQNRCRWCGDRPPRCTRDRNAACSPTGAPGRSGHVSRRAAVRPARARRPGWWSCRNRCNCHPVYRVNRIRAASAPPTAVPVRRGAGPRAVRQRPRSRTARARFRHPGAGARSPPPEPPGRTRSRGRHGQSPVSVVTPIEPARGPAGDLVPVSGHPPFQPGVTRVLLRGRPYPGPVRAPVSADADQVLWGSRTRPPALTLASMRPARIR